MSETRYELDSGADFRVAHYDRYNPPPGEVTWFDTDTSAVSTSGPALTVSFDLAMPHAAGAELAAVVRLLDEEGYLTSPRPEYQDPDGILAVTATLWTSEEGLAENVVVVLPYATFPEGVGGSMYAELTVHEVGGRLGAMASFEVELPDDLDRNPDVLTVMAHTLIALAKCSGRVTRDEVRVIRHTLLEYFELDDLGDHTLRRILKTANRVVHTPETLSEVVKLVVPTSSHEVFVDLLYTCAKADGVVDAEEQAFIDRLIELLGIHDHRRYGAVRLRPYYETLEVEPGSDLKVVKKAYKQLVRDYHPDRVATLARGFQDFAHEKMKSLNQAYAELRQALEAEERRGV